MVVGASFCIGVDGDRTGPQFFSSNPRKVNGSFPVHAWCGGNIAVQLIACHNSHALMFPLAWLIFFMVMRVI
jgi:hypothetical protein